MPEEKMIRVLIIEPMRNPKEMYVPNDLCFFKYYVSMGNYYMCDVEFICLEDGVGILKNEEGQLLNLKGNRKLGSEIIAGTFFVVGVDKSGFITSLSEEHFAKYSNRFSNIETYSDAEVSRAYWKKFEESLKP